MNMVRAHKGGGRSGKALWRSAKTKSTAVVRLSKATSAAAAARPAAAGSTTPPLAPVAIRTGGGSTDKVTRSTTPEGFYLTHGERLAGVEQDVTQLKADVGALRGDVQAMRAELSSLVSGLKVLCSGLEGKPTG